MTVSSKGSRHRHIELRVTAEECGLVKQALQSSFELMEIQILL